MIVSRIGRAAKVAALVVAIALVVTVAVVDPTGTFHNLRTGAVGAWHGMVRFGGWCARAAKGLTD